MHRCGRLARSMFLIPALLLASLAACDPRRATETAVLVALPPGTTLLD